MQGTPKLRVRCCMLQLSIHGMEQPSVVYGRAGPRTIQSALSQACEQNISSKGFGGLMFSAAAASRLRGSSLVLPSCAARAGGAAESLRGRPQDPEFGGFGRSLAPPCHAPFSLRSFSLL